MNEYRINKYIALCGICSRREADGLIEAGAEVETVTMKTTSVVIKATIDVATGQFKSLNYNIKQDATMTNVKYTVAKVAKATGTVVNDVTFSDFKY